MDYWKYTVTDTGNTEICEQTNSWLGGFQNCVKPMKTSSANFFLAEMVDYHNAKRTHELLIKGYNPTPAIIPILTEALDSGFVPFGIEVDVSIDPANVEIEDSAFIQSRDESTGIVELLGGLTIT